MQQNDAKEIIKRLDRLSSKFDRKQIFMDFLSLTAYRISNAVDPVHLDERQALASEVLQKYTHLETAQLDEILKLLLDGIAHNIHMGQLEDILGTVFELLGNGSKAMGQDFTPPSICRLMAQLIGIPKEERVFTLNEPCCGSGAMILAYAEQMQLKGRNYCAELVVLAQDLDIRCVLMTYIQLSLYGIPAVVLHANTMTVEEYDRWYTPAYILGKWVWRNPMSMTGSRSLEDEKLKVYQEPLYGLIRYSGLMNPCEEKMEVDFHNAV